MLYSQLLIPTLREAPADAEIVSHQLMVRAGMIRQVARGIYNYLPLGLRVIRKVEAIVREELNRAGCQEVLLPIVVPSELWKETGRWDQYGKELLRVKDRSDRDFCIGPTHEEVITDLVRREIRSYRDLPKNFYQIGPKYRDEIRPRFGLMRAREFLMKDGYSFHTSYEDLDRHYEMMRETYQRIFERCGLPSRVVDADPGAIGGSSSHEVMVLADTGEDAIAVCDKCDYAANVETAVCRPHPNPPLTKGRKAKRMDVKKVHTPGLKSIEEVSPYLGIEPELMIKTIVYLRDGGAVVALIAGNLEINEIKLKNAAGAQWVVLASDKDVELITGAAVGYAGPIGLPKEVKGVGPVTVIADHSVEGIVNGATGANETDYHLTRVNPGRDFMPDKYADLSIAREGDVCAHCGKGKLRIIRGIEVGHIFKLGTKYSSAMKATFLDESGNGQPIIMGTYGIGIGRTAQAAVEQSHDDQGIIWPMAIAPFHVEVIGLNLRSEKVRAMSEKVYKELVAAGIEVLYDDRDERPGVKFADADLIGIPYQAIIGEKAVKENKIELKERKGGKREMVGVGEIVRRCCIPLLCKEG